MIDFNPSKKHLWFFAFLFSSCAAIYGWKIHAPGVLSGNYASQVLPLNARIALYLPPKVYTEVSQNKGGWTADPQTYYLGEAFAPMVLEAFQGAFEEFIFLETEPSAEILRHYAVPYLAMVRISDFKNKVTLKGQAVELQTETVIYDTDLKLLARIRTTGSSDAKKIFAKKGGPEINLNAAIENNVISIIQYLQDALRAGKWEKI